MSAQQSDRSNMEQLEQDLRDARKDIRELTARIEKMDSLVSLRLGKDGDFDDLRDKVDGMNNKMLIASGGAAVVMQVLRLAVSSISINR